MEYSEGSDYQKKKKKSKKKSTSKPSTDESSLSPADLAAANAAGMTPAAYIAAYPTEDERKAASGESSNTAGPTASDPGKGGKKGGGKGGAKPLTPAQMETQIEQEAAKNAWNQLGVDLTNEAESEQAPIQAAITGQNTGADVQSMENQALAAAGVSPNSSAAQWLTSNLQQGAAADEPLMSAMNAYGKAYGAGQQGIDQSLSNMGAANALGTATSPETSWLSGLGSHIQSNLNYYGQIPTTAAQNLPPALLHYLQLSGTGGGGGQGVTSLSNLNVSGAPTNAPTLPPVTTAAGGATNTALTNDAGNAPS